MNKKTTIYRLDPLKAQIGRLVCVCLILSFLFFCSICFVVGSSDFDLSVSSGVKMSLIKERKNA